jgi:predicted transposase YbfD/YdcC
MNATTKSLCLVETFAEIIDQRDGPALRHKLRDIIVIACCTYLTGGKTFTDMESFGIGMESWLRTFLELPNGIPSHDTFNRVFQFLDPKQFGECFVRWMQSIRLPVHGEVVALDGKALRRAARDGSIPCMVSAWSSHNSLVLGQLRVREKSNEITAVPELLRLLELAGCIVTIDAMGCQRSIAREIVDADADYVLALKGNQGTTHAEVKTFLDDAILNTPECLSYSEETDNGHGRIETRRCWQTNQLVWFADREDWEKLTTIGVVESVREIKGQTTTERRYYLSSLAPDAKRLAQAVRLHWGIENKVHWVLDVQFREDDCRARNGYAAENLATLRHLVLNILRADTTRKGSLHTKMYRAAIDCSYLLHLLGNQLITKT